ncbi:MAG: hypothetical protein GY868_19000, partial [Deltaproteobacteria bacterium]|nr:hypothetical protein [Deltaproteobacteria bacterium]
MNNLKPAFLILAILTPFLFLSACAVHHGPVYEKDGKTYGRVQGIFCSKWNDFYARGLTYVEGGFWQDAVRDMKESVRQRDGDQRRARTYGLHFTDYFPRRELGIAYFNLNNYPEAISQLEKSLKQTPSARAKYYLNKARRQSINESGGDTQLPQIAVTFPPPQYVTNAFSLDLAAAVSDDTFLEGIALNSTFKPLELSARRIALSESIALKPGKNNITLQARD